MFQHSVWLRIGKKRSEFSREFNIIFKQKQLIAHFIVCLAFWRYFLIAAHMSFHRARGFIVCRVFSPYKRLFNFLPEMKNYRNVSLKIFLWERQTLQRIINLLKVSQEWFNGNFCSFYSQGERKPHKRFFFIIFITLFPFISFLRLWLIQKFCPNFCSSYCKDSGVSSFTNNT